MAANNLESSDEHYTPKILFDLLGLQFDLDVASPHEPTNVPALKRYCKCCFDGLSNEWFGRVWMNPPFSKPSPWVDKFIEHRNGIALLVVSKSLWFNKIWNEADAIIPMQRQWKFDRPDGKSKTISFQSFLFALGNENAEALTRLPDYNVR